MPQSKKSDSTSRSAAAKKAATDPPKRKQETVKVHLRDDNPQTFHDVKRLVVLLDGEVKSEGKDTLTVLVPLGSDRDPSAARNKLIGNLATDPLVMEVTDS